MNQSQGLKVWQTFYISGNRKWLESGCQGKGRSGKSGTENASSGHGNTGTYLVI